jgi:hypothetical protein
LLARHLIAHRYAEYICLFEGLFPATGMPRRAATGTTCECARQKLRCLMTEAVIAHRSRNSHEIWSTADRVIARLTKAAFG